MDSGWWTALRWCDGDETAEHVLRKCYRFEEERRESQGEDAVEYVRLGLRREVMEDGC